MARRKWTLDTINDIVNDKNPFIQFGYDKIPEQRKNGDVWIDSKGKKWKKENGAIIQINEKADLIRDFVKRKCSKCGARIDFSCEKMDQKVFSKTGKCYSCLEVEEFELRVLGKWEDYEKSKLLHNRRGWLKDVKEKITEAIEFLKNDTGIMEHILEDGETRVKFKGKYDPKWLIDAEEDLKKVDEELNKVDDELKSISNS